jgi:histone H2A
VYLAAVLQYLAAEILELAGNQVKNDKKTRILPRHIQLATHYDEELDRLVANGTFSNGGVVPYIHKALLPKNS